MAVADIVIKQESIEAVDLEGKILALCVENGKGISDAVIQQNMPSIPAQQRVMAINRLLSTVYVNVYETWSWCACVTITAIPCVERLQINMCCELCLCTLSSFFLPRA